MRDNPLAGSTGFNGEESDEDAKKTQQENKDETITHKLGISDPLADFH